ncbi:MAG: substrate-binding domain-containing protein [Anaerolineales bacterium]|jgi:molybdate-binding protein/DNA-binding transcriptional regulator YhcF (GntR family)
MSSTEAHLFEQIAESIRLQIAHGELKAGDRLPSIRDLAEEWACTPGTVNRAYAILADEGLVTSRRGSGTIVNANPLLDEQAPLRSAFLTNQIENLILNLLGRGYTESEIETSFSLALARWQDWQKEAARQIVSLRENQLRFVGSHDLAIELLAEEVAKENGFHLTTSFRGSLGGLIALARGEADIAGSHLWDKESNQYNIPYVQRVLPGERVVLVTVAGRSFGLMVPAGNPQSVQSLRDLTKPGVRWINRQPGSGTRVWLDTQLKQLGLDEGEIEGFNDIKTTHNEIAEAIKNGQATTGLGIQAAASAFGLDFIPLAVEKYQLVIPEAVWETAVCQHLLKTLQEEQFQETITNLGGYDTTETSKTLWVG